MKKLLAAILFVSLIACSFGADQIVPPVIAGQSAKFTVTCSGTAPFTYQWYKDGVAIGSPSNATMTGMTSDTLSFTYAPTDAGVYTVQVTNKLGSVMSDKVTLSTYAAPSNVTITVTIVNTQTTATKTAAPTR